MAPTTRNRHQKKEESGAPASPLQSLPNEPKPRKGRKAKQTSTKTKAPGNSNAESSVSKVSKSKKSKAPKTKTHQGKQETPETEAPPREDFITFHSASFGFDNEGFELHTPTTHTSPGNVDTPSASPFKSCSPLKDRAKDFLHHFALLPSSGRSQTLSDRDEESDAVTSLEGRDTSSTLNTPCVVAKGSLRDADRKSMVVIYDHFQPGADGAAWTTFHDPTSALEIPTELVETFLFCLSESDKKLTTFTVKERPEPTIKRKYDTFTEITALEAPRKRAKATDSPVTKTNQYYKKHQRGVKVKYTYKDGNLILPGQETVIESNDGTDENDDLVGVLATDRRQEAKSRSQHNSKGTVNNDSDHNYDAKTEADRTASAVSTDIAIEHPVTPKSGVLNRIVSSVGRLFGRGTQEYAGSTFEPPNYTTSINRSASEPHEPNILGTPHEDTTARGSKGETEADAGPVLVPAPSFTSHQENVETNLTTVTSEPVINTELGSSNVQEMGVVVETADDPENISNLVDDSAIDTYRPRASGYLSYGTSLEHIIVATLDPPSRQDFDSMTSNQLDALARQLNERMKEVQAAATQKGDSATFEAINESSTLRRGTKKHKLKKDPIPVRSVTGAFELNEDFVYDPSDSDGELVTDSDANTDSEDEPDAWIPSKNGRYKMNPAKRPRLSDNNDFNLPTFAGSHEATPYTGKVFADPKPNVFTDHADPAIQTGQSFPPTSPGRTYDLVYSSDSDGSDEEINKFVSLDGFLSTPSPKPRTTVDTRSSGVEILPTKDMGQTIPPPAPQPAHAKLPVTTSLGASQALAQARAQAQRYAPKQPSALRESSRLSNSTLPSEPDSENNRPESAKAFTQDEITSPDTEFTSVSGNSLKPERFFPLVNKDQLNTQGSLKESNNVEKSVQNVLDTLPESQHEPPQISETVQAKVSRVRFEEIPNIHLFPSEPEAMSKDLSVKSALKKAWSAKDDFFADKWFKEAINKIRSGHHIRV